MEVLIGVFDHVVAVVFEWNQPLLNFSKLCLFVYSQYHLSFLLYMPSSSPPHSLTHAEVVVHTPALTLQSCAIASIRV